MKIDLTCPVELWHFALPSERNSFVSLHLFNLGDRTVNSIQAAYLCYNEQGERLSRQLERVQGLRGEKRSSFEMQVLIEDGLKAASMDFIIERVWFDDGTVWRRNPGGMTEYVPNFLPRGRRLEVLQYLAGTDALGYPSDQGAVWVCVCGRPNPANRTECARCERDKHATFTQFNEAAVEKIIFERESALEEKARQAREEAGRMQKEREELELKQRKRRKRITLALTAVILLSGAAYGVYFHAIPAYRYYQADRYLKSGEYEKAKAAFLEIAAYSDSLTRIDEANYKSALESMETGTLTSLSAAQAGFDALGDYMDSAAMALEARYLRADKLLRSKAFDAAVALFEELGDYKEADGKVLQSHYEWAQDMLSKLEYDAAREKFLSLGDYKNSVLLAQECLFRPALTAMEEKDYAQAIALFSQLPERQDARLKLPEAHYLWGDELFIQGEYDPAAEQFLAAADYKDAWRRATECLYQPAVEKFQKGEYAAAKEMFDKIPTFEDAARLSEESSYQMGVIALRAGSYEEAIALFGQAPGVALAQQLLKEANYQAGLKQQQAGENEAAAAYFRAAGDYQNAAVLAQESLYLAGIAASNAKDFTKAVDLFLSLGDYSDSAEELQRALYNRAVTALENKEYESAVQQFTALGNYERSAERLKEAQYQLALQSLEKGETAEAAARFAALGNYMDAAEQYKESVYRQAKALLENEQPVAASPLLSGIQGYKDATDLFHSVTYTAAQTLQSSGDPGRAAELFASLGGYLDAREMSEAAYDAYYSAAYERAQQAIAAEDYRTAVEALEPLDRGNPGEKYGNVDAMYQDAVYRYAEKLYEEGKAYEALPYYRRIADYRDVSSRKLTRNSYRILGKWESTKGVLMEFREDGTCTIEGREMYFLAVLYRLSTGDLPGELSYTHNIVRLTETGMTLRDERIQKVFKMTRAE